ncbi:phosphotransferase family protein [Amycolatopsis rhabdoformis]|uniref:Phosphotransferase family protein n=1 Tax=Amycolatopsis rhabdoformis TaxID=1448059 RepID=A0ABZ1I139_9PSEU|nr:phosphotransferase family protein [Amycolatopsis rhabdoformis]WSE28125.1 phosphotransferase family protein [Amycolatopsis rhabdoformis]
MTTQALERPLAGWLTAHTGDPGPWALKRLTGGNSNETCLLTGSDTSYVLRRPPSHVLSKSAHSVAREHRLLSALAPTAVRVPKPVALCEDTGVPLAPFLVMEHVGNAVSITDTMPYPQIETVADEVVDALAAVHTLDWRAAGLEGFGRPENFLDRQVERWYRQWEGIARRPLSAMPKIATWLDANKPQPSAPALLHGDFHLDNCLFDAHEPRLKAVIDWEMATIGDPLLDLGLLLALWGGRGSAMPAVQGVSRAPGAPPREHLLQRYEQQVGRAIPQIRYYQCLALFKLAAIVEAAWSQYLTGELTSEYAAALEHDVPALLDEALDTAGLAP